MILMVGFTASIVRRVGRIRHNAKRLDEGRPLDEPDSSQDELGSLSRALVRTGSHLSELQEELRRLATVDELTKLANRRGFFALGEHQLLVAARTRSAVALLFIDVDGLKNVNDVLGHATGDLLLKEAADVIRETIRVSDLAGRHRRRRVLRAPHGGPGPRSRASGRSAPADRPTNTTRDPGGSSALSLSIGLSALPPGGP